MEILICNVSQAFNDCDDVTVIIMILTRYLLSLSLRLCALHSL